MNRHILKLIRNIQGYVYVKEKYEPRRTTSINAGKSVGVSFIGFILLHLHFKQTIKEGILWRFRF